MKRILTAILLIASTAGFAQATIKGKIIDSETGLSLPYVNIGIPGTNVGTVSNNQGAFSLNLKENMHRHDTIRFSFIGYKTQEFPVSTLSKKENSIELTPEINQLQEVVFSSKEPKNKKLGRTHKGLGTMWYNLYTAGEKVDDRLSKEFGMKFKLRNDCRMNSLNFYIGQNQYELIKFRVNFYHLENNLPGKVLNDEDIVFEVKNGASDWFTVDLDSYNIYLEEELEEVAVSIQWLESEKKNPESKFFSIPGAFSPFDTMYFREKGMADWEKNNFNLSFYLDVDSY